MRSIGGYERGATQGSTRVLIVDDDPQVLLTLKRVLAHSGCEVTEAENVDRAGQLIDDTAFDVIVSDLNIADGSGIDVLRRAHARSPGLPVILLTGSPDLESAISSVQLGAFRYLLKPFRNEELAGVVSEAASSRRTSAMNRLVVERHELELERQRSLCSNLDRGIEGLFLAYQPIVDWTTREVRAYEALLRTKEPTMPNPGAMLSAAEALGRLHPLGQAIRGRAASDCSSVRHHLFVNLHAADLLDESLFDPDAPLSKLAGRVVLELTERVSLADVRDFRARMSRLRQLGFKIAIDDLGEGYAGLSCLAKIEPEVIKLDMSLVRGVAAAGSASRRLIRSMVEFAKESGAELIAEGVETTFERDALLDLGCHLFQGYLFARPALPFPSIAW